jgi:hypothetical protein
VIRQQSTKTGGPPATPPPDLDATTAEGPMRRELLRQIAHLDQQISLFVHDNCPFEPLPAAAHRGPAVLSTAELEAIRDELLATRTHLHERIVARVTDRMGLDDAGSPGSGGGMWARLRRRLKR